MRPLLILGALALVSLAQPAAAQMCGAGQQPQASPSGGMMCGGMKAADDPMADKPAQKPQQSGMCSCCGKMAMMRGGGMMPPQHDMPGMTPRPQ